MLENLYYFLGSQVEKNFRLEVPIFKQYHKNVIGKKGGNISKIREETGTQVNIFGESYIYFPVLLGERTCFTHKKHFWGK